MNLSPKVRFQKSPDAKLFADMAASVPLQHAIEAALSEFQLSAPREKDAAANWHRLEGAKDFAWIFLNLSETPKEAKRGNPKENLQPT